MPKAKEKKVLVPNPDLLAAFRGYRPVFGNQEDIWIQERVESLERKLRLVDNAILRGKPANHTSKMKEILRDELYLIDAITSRKDMDF